LAIVAVVLWALSLLPQPAFAQVVGPFPSWPGGSLEPAAVGPLSETVFRRPRPDYDPLGVRVGGFIVSPTLTVAGKYDSNVFATQTGAKDDFILDVIPALGIASDWNLHAVSLSASGDFQKHAKLSSEDVNNGSVDLAGRYDISNGEYIAADALYQLLHENRQSPNAVFGKNPTEYKIMGYDLAYVHMVGRLGFRIDNTLTSYDFNNATSSTGATLNQQFRDRNEYVIAPRVQYEIVPGYNAFIRALGNERQYFSQECGTLSVCPPPGGHRRNSHGWEVDAGTAIEITRITTAEIYVGYIKQDYEDPFYKSVSGIGFGGNLIWNVTPLTSVIGSFSQSVAETTLATASSSLETNFQVTVQHELLRNLLLLGSVGFVHDNYQGNPRTDDTFGVDVGARYLLNRNWTATADFNYSQRDSNVPGGSYNRVTGIVSVKYAF
jgi:hypothetical protein